MMLRGQIRNVALGTQVRDYSGLTYAKITPTDIDGIIEMDHKLVIIYEIKHKDAPVPDGQRWVFERIVDALNKTHYAAYLLYVEHSMPPEQPIDVAQCLVSSCYHSGQRYQYVRPHTAKAVTDSIIQRVLPERWERDFQHEKKKDVRVS